jgi:hypothetical protein
MTVGWYAALNMIDPLDASMAMAPVHLDGK